MLMARAGLIALVILAAAALPAFSQAIQTPGELSGYTRYTQSQEVAQFIDQVSKATPRARVRLVGKTAEAKDFAAANIYLVVLTAGGTDTPSSLDRSKPTILVLAAQHGNEQSGKEAALRLIRDLAVGELEPLLQRVNVLVMPQTNPYGNFVDRRTNEQDLDLNRDHVKLESPETRAIHAVFRAWMPEVTLDVHEQGDNYYRVNTGRMTNANIAPALRAFAQNTIYRETEALVTSRGYTWHEYLVTEAMGSQGAAGAAEPTGANLEMLTRPSTVDLNDGRNSLGIYETISFIQESASRHDLPTLKDRSTYQYLGIRGLVESVARHADQVRDLVRSSRAALGQKAGAPEPGDLVHLRMAHVRDPKEPSITVQHFERPAGADAASSTSMKVVTEVVGNWFPGVEPTVSVPRARGYIVPAAHKDVVQTMVAHGIAVQEFTKDAMVEVERYTVDDLTPSTEDYVAPEKIAVTKKAVTVPVTKGDYYVSGAQPAANLIPNLLEPQAEFGFLRYRMYKLVPEKGATFPFLRVVRQQALPLAAVK